MNKETKNVYQFDIDKILQPNVNVHCRTEEQAIALCEWAHGLGKTWSSGDSYLSITYWKVCKENSVYAIHTGRIGSKSNIKETILDFEEVAYTANEGQITLITSDPDGLSPTSEEANQKSLKGCTMLKLKEDQSFDELNLVILSIESKGSTFDLFYINTKTIQTIKVDELCRYLVIINDEIEIRFRRSDYEKVELNQLEDWIDNYLLIEG
jgi:hypothetical protein